MKEYSTQILRPSYIIHFFLIAAVYILFDITERELGVKWGVPQNHAIPIWIPSGIAIAALVVWSRNLWPAIWIGSFLHFSLLDPKQQFDSLPFACFMATVATAETLIGAYFIKRYAPRMTTLDHVNDVVLFLLVMVLIIPLFSAAAVDLSAQLFFIAEAGKGDWWSAGFYYWMDNALGILVGAPLLFALLSEKLFPDNQNPWRYLEAGLLAAVIFFIGKMISLYAGRMEYFFIPCVIFAVFRFGQIGGLLSTLLIFAIEIFNIFSDKHTYLHYDSVLFLQIFVGIIALTALLLGATLSERNQRTKDFQRAAIDALESANKAQEMREEIAKAYKIKSDFLATISHEVRTPLNHIIGYSDLMIEELPESDIADYLPDLNKIESAAKHLLKLFEDIFDMSKIEAGKVEINNEPFHLKPLAEELVESMRPLAEKNGNTINIQLAIDDDLVISDKSKVQRILSNLLENACKFTSNGTISLDIKRKSEGENNWIIATVSDTGIGISEKLLETLFQPFVRTEDLSYGGSGLGLAISKNFSLLMGGDISVKSQWGSGSTFTVRFLEGV